MALWHCTNCTAAYAVGLAACPQCGDTDHTEDETVPKINREGPSYEPGKEPYGTVPPPVDAEPDQPEPETPADAAAAAPRKRRQAPAAAPADQTPPPPPPPAA